MDRITANVIDALMTYRIISFDSLIFNAFALYLPVQAKLHDNVFKQKMVWNNSIVNKQQIFNKIYSRCANHSITISWSAEFCERRRLDLQVSRDYTDFRMSVCERVSGWVREWASCEHLLNGMNSNQSGAQRQIKLKIQRKIVCKEDTEKKLIIVIYIYSWVWLIIIIITILYLRYFITYPTYFIFYIATRKFSDVVAGASACAQFEKV